MIVKLKKMIKWDEHETWQKVLIVILLFIMLPIVLIALFFKAFPDTSPEIENDKWHHEKQKEKVDKDIKQIDRLFSENKEILKKREDEIKGIEDNNEKYNDIAADIESADTADELDELRKRINKL